MKIVFRNKSAALCGFALCATAGIMLHFAIDMEETLSNGGGSPLHAGATVPLEVAGGKTVYVSTDQSTQLRLKYAIGVISLILGAGLVLYGVKFPSPSDDGAKNAA